MSSVETGDRVRGVGVDGFAIQRVVNVAAFKAQCAALHTATAALTPPIGVVGGDGGAGDGARLPLPVANIRPLSQFEQVEERIQAGLDELMREQAALDAANPPKATRVASSSAAPKTPVAKRRSKGAAVALATGRGSTVIVLPPSATEWAGAQIDQQLLNERKARKGAKAKAATAATADASTASTSTVVQPPSLPPPPPSLLVVAQSDAVHKSERDSLLRALGNPADTSDVVREQEVLLTVVLMQPNRDVRMIEIDVLASQELTALADAFDCPSSHNALALPECRNQLMYIEGTFYDDTRHDGAVRYSEPLVQWLRQCGDVVSHNIDLVPCSRAQVRDMQRTRLLDLDVRLHAPYLYVHQGDCAHVFAFQALRRACSVDPPRRSAYPRLIERQLPRERRCAICDIYPAKYVTVADRWAPEDPCLFCERCYAPLHYDEHGELLPNWPAFGGAEFVQDFGVA